MLKIPLCSGVEGAFEADEETILVRLEVVNGLGRDDRIEAEEASLVRVADKNDLVPGEPGLGREGVIEHEALLEQYLFAHGFLVELDVEGGFLLRNVALEHLDIFSLGLLRIGNKLHARKTGFCEGVDLETERIGKLALRVAGKQVLCGLLLFSNEHFRAIDCDVANALEPVLVCDTAFSSEFWQSSVITLRKLSRKSLRYFLILTI